MNSSRYQQRAEKIHGSNYKTQKPKDDISKQVYWEQHVKSREDVITFYNLYYPYLPDVLVQALANHIQDQVDGKIPPTEQFYKHSKTNTNLNDGKWDYKKDLEREKIDAQMALTGKRLADLMNE